MLCCQHSSQKCSRKVIPLRKLPIEQHRKKYEENLRKLGQPTPSLEVANKTACAPQCTTCGTRALHGDVNVIINGQNAPAKHHPWQVYVRAPTLSCGGVLIGPKWVLTAAHCIARTTYIMLGDTSIANPSPQRVYRWTVKDIAHEDFGDLKNDIGLIKMKAPVLYNEYIRPICLPPPDIDFTTSEECFVTGWGYIDYDLRIKSDQLQQVRVRVMSHESCYRMWSAGHIMGPGNVCTVLNVTSPHSGACSGDSGGPLVCRHGDKYYLVGITSLVQNECRKTYLPDLFTRVAYFNNWIEDKMQTYSDD